MDSLPTKAERQQLANKATARDRQQRLAKRRQEQKEEKAYQEAFNEQCEKAYQGCLARIKSAIEYGLTECFYTWYSGTKYELQRAPEHRNLDAMRRIVSDRINKEFPDYHAEPGFHFYEADNMAETYENGGEYRTWTEKDEAILIKWEN